MVWLKRIAITLAALALLLLGGGFLLPSSAHVERSIVINVPQDQVFTVINSFERFNDWSPWAELDPNTRYEFAGPVTGVGAKLSWASDDASVGAGSQEIIESTPPTLVRNKLVFAGQGDAVTFMRLEALEAGTQVIWGFDSEFGNDVVGRWFGFLMFDSMLGADYEKGLRKLKTLLEQKSDTAPAEPSASPEPTAAPAQNPEPAAQATG
ncbi:SRPBCC family protein [Permianibacter sp. IMCC34836]|uniref:SRPBCC family protein n=1 Tax=Permianibacter fluminis TaxID=2738515 RepID=UPI001554FB9B|nr:SRPBCC family protein [Permianibacter fluminis]NQD35707.1 SRPBCC family protein [Permianibacter fluminis]